MGSNIICAVGAILLFGAFLSSSNREMTLNTRVAEQNEYYITAISLAQSLIDEAKTKAFDVKTIGVSNIPRNGLTASLGREPGEGFPMPDTLLSTSPYTPAAQGYLSVNRFNDVDDYNQYVRIVNTQRAERFQIKSAVTYVSESDPMATSGSQTFCKRMDVTVSSPFLTDSVRLSYVYSY